MFLTGTATREAICRLAHRLFQLPPGGQDSAVDPA